MLDAGKPLRVLLVSASAGEVKTLGGPLAREGCAVVVAKSAAAACDALAKQGFDAAVVSLPLPDAEALGACAALRAVAGCPPILAIDSVDRSAELARALPGDARPARCVVRPVDAAKLALLLRELGTEEPPPDASVGRLGFANVLVNLAERGETGVLAVHSAAATTRIYVRGGAPVSVEGGSLRDSLGRLLVRTGALSESEYERVIARMTERVIDNEHQRMGEVLIALGLMKPIDVYQALSRQAGEKIVACFATERVALELETTDAALEGIEALAIPPFPALLVEAVKRHFDADAQNDLVLPLAGERMKLRSPAPDLRLGADDARIAASVAHASCVAEVWRANEAARATLAALALTGALVPQAAPAKPSGTPFARIQPIPRAVAQFAREVVAPRKPGEPAAARSGAQGREGVPARDAAQERFAAEQSFRDAHKLIAREKFEEALTLLRRAVSLDPNEPEYRLLEAWVAYLAARVAQRIARAKAVACARRAIENDPRAAQPHTILGRLYLDDGDAAAAARELELALLRDPNDADAKKHLAAARAAKSTGK